LLRVFSILLRQKSRSKKGASLIVQTIFSKCFASSSCCLATEERRGGEGNQIGPRASSPEPRPPYFHENTTTTTYNLVVHQNSTSDFLTKNIFLFYETLTKGGGNIPKEGDCEILRENSAELVLKQQLPKKSGTGSCYGTTTSNHKKMGAILSWSCSLRRPNVVTRFNQTKKKTNIKSK
jgi:hypothetical protein